MMFSDSRLISSKFTSPAGGPAFTRFAIICEAEAADFKFEGEKPTA